MTHAIGDPPPPHTRQPVRVELYALAHSEVGEPLAHHGALSLALAGAILIDLIVPSERIRLIGGHIMAISKDLSRDPVADWATRVLDVYRPATLLHNRRASLTVGEALRQLAVTSYHRTTAGLIAGDLVREVSRRRKVGTKYLSYPPTDEAFIRRVRGRLHSAVQGDQPSPHTDALAGLMLALSLESELYLAGSGDDLRAVMQQMVDRVGEPYPAIQEIIATTDALIGEAAVAVYG